jgi:hypothetical protein
MIGRGVSVPNITTYLLKQYNYSISNSTLSEYIKNYVISDKQLQPLIASKIQEMDDKRKDTALKIPSNIVDLIEEKRKIINELQSRIDIIKRSQEKKFSTSSEFLIQRYYNDISARKDEIDKYLIQYEIESLVSYILRRTVTLTFEIFLPFVPESRVNEVSDKFKDRILVDFKNIREKIYSKKK